MNLSKRLEDDEVEGEDAYCPCCNLPLEADLFPMCVNSQDLGELGSGFSLYYDLIKWLIGICVL
jgi:hypothetical protein